MLTSFIFSVHGFIDYSLQIYIGNNWSDAWWNVCLERELGLINFMNHGRTTQTLALSWWRYGASSFQFRLYCWPNINWVVHCMKGSGRAFCAGGDVVRLRELISEGGWL